MREFHPNAPLDPVPRATLENGFAIAEFFALFFYFLNHTPEGAAVKKELETDWQASINHTKEQKLLSGSPWSLEKWLKQLRQTLATPNRALEKLEPKKSPPKNFSRSSLNRAKKGLKFKNAKTY